MPIKKFAKHTAAKRLQKAFRLKKYGHPLEGQPQQYGRPVTHGGTTRFPRNHPGFMNRRIMTQIGGTKAVQHYGDPTFMNKTATQKRRYLTGAHTLDSDVAVYGQAAKRRRDHQASGQLPPPQWLNWDNPENGFGF